jgi:hypothetical protein
MQRRKPISNSRSQNGSSPGIGKINNINNNNKYVLPTTSMNTNKITVKAKQSKKKNVSLVTRLVQTIAVLMVATSVLMIYIASTKADGDLNFDNITNSNSNSNVNTNPAHDRKDSSSHSTPKHYKNNMNIGANTSSGVGIDAGRHKDADAVNENDEDLYKSDKDEMKDEAALAKALSNASSSMATPKKRRTRTTAEANAYMASQPTFSVDGEKGLKKELQSLYDMQIKGLEKKSPIVTRWIGEKDSNDQKMKYWLPKSKTSDEALEAWKSQVEKLKDDMRKKDVELFPALHGQKVDMVGSGKTTSVQGKEPPKTKAGDSSSGATDSSTEYQSPAPEGTHVILKPTFGTHREGVDAVFALAEGYDLKIYLLFIESLIATGFNGDLVLSVSALGSLKPGVEEYLRSNQLEANQKGVNVVAYTVSWNCFNSDGTEADGANEGVRKCELVGMYGEDADEHAIRDTREPRPVATARFELYWAWSQYYAKDNWIMLIDSRDAHFQTNPFAGLERDVPDDKGRMYFFAVSFVHRLIFYLCSEISDLT